jgi:protein-disulfide isomerase
VYGDSVRIVWKHHPLTSIHKDAKLAHVASQAAHEQGRFWEYHDRLFSNPKALQRDNLLKHARELGLDMKAFEAALDSPKHSAAVEADVAEAQSMGATGTPAFFVNGRYLYGAKPFEEFSRVINEELTRLKVPIPPGAAPKS